MRYLEKICSHPKGGGVCINPLISMRHINAMYGNFRTVTSRINRQLSCMHSTCSLNFLKELEVLYNGQVGVRSDGQNSTLLSNNRALDGGRTNGKPVSAA